VDERKPIEEMTAVEMAGELNQRREADAGIILLAQQNAALRAILYNYTGIQVAFSPEETEAIINQNKQNMEEQNGI
jgi:hypothetical protein